MKIKLLFAQLILLSGIAFSQKSDLINQTDSKGLKQGIWRKTYNDGALRYEGKFENDIPVGTFKYYYEDGKRLSSVLEYYNKGTQADAKLYYLEGKLMGQGKYLNQKKDSIWKYFDKSERLVAEESYQNTKKNGRWTVYYKAGNLASEKNYVKDLEHGEWKEYFENGKLKMQATFKDGNLDGRQTNYYPNGLKMEEGNYQSSVKNGIWFSYHENGNVKQKDIYKNGILQNSEKLNGQFFEYFADGIPKALYNYKDGKKNGVFKIYHENGKWVRNIQNQGTPQEFVDEYIDGQTLKMEGNYKDDQYEGKILYYKLDGSIEKEENYVNGNLIKP